MSMKLDRRAFLGTALTFGALCAASPSAALGITAAEKKEQVQAVRAKLNSLADELDAAVDAYNSCYSKYQKATEKVEACKKQIEEAQATIDTLQTHLNTRAASMYRNGNTSYLDVLLGVQSFDDFATVWDTLNNLNAEDADLVIQTKQAKAKLEAAKKELDEQQAEAESQLAAAKSYQSEIESKEAEYQSEYNSLNAEYKRLLKQEQEAAERAAQAASAAYTPHTTPSNSGSSSGGSSSSSGGSSSGGSSSSSGGSSGSSLPTNGSVVDYAYSRLGCPYVWGAEGPNSFDCSGLTRWCYLQVGISIDHYTESQYAQAKARLSVNSASAGDVLYRSGHVSIYAGGDTYIHAPHTGDVVREAYGINSFSAALRF